MKEKRYDEEKDYVIFYELLGVFLIVLLFVTLLMIGNIGKYLNIFLRMLIGDFYTIFLVIAFIFSLKLLFKFNTNLLSLRFNGMYLLFISLSLLSHKDIYLYSLNFSNNPITGLFTLYKMYFNSFDSSYVYGGGIILGTIYHVFYFLFQEASIIIYFILLFISIVFLSNNTIKGFFIKLKSFKGINFKRVIEYIKNLQIDKRLSINILTSFIEEKREPNKKGIEIVKEIIKNMGLDFNMIDFYVSYSYTSISLDLSIDPYIFKDKIEDKLKMNALVYYNNNLIIEIPNERRYLLTLKNLVADFGLAIGYSNKKEEWRFSELENIFINGEPDSGIITYIKALIAEVLILTDKKIIIFDKKKEILDVNNKRVTSYIDSHPFINEINYIVDSLSNYLVIINDYYSEDLDYFLRNCVNKNIYSVLINRNNPIDKRILNNFKTRILFKSNLLYSKLILNERSAVSLLKKGDAIIIYNNISTRIQTPYISNNDFDKLIRRI